MYHFVTNIFLVRDSRGWIFQSSLEKGKGNSPEKNQVKNCGMSFEITDDDARQVGTASFCIMHILTGC